METGKMDSQEAVQRISETSTLSADVEPFVPRQYQAVPSHEHFLSYEEQSSIPIVPSYITNCYPFVQEEYLRYELPQWAAYVPNAPTQPPFPGMGMADLGPPCPYSQGYALSMGGKGSRHGRSKTNMLSPSPRSRNWANLQEGYNNPEAIRAGSDQAYDNSYGRWDLNRPSSAWSLGQDQPPLRSPGSSRVNSSRRGSRSARESSREQTADRRTDDLTSDDTAKEGSVSSRGKGPSMPATARYHSRTLGDFLSHVKTSKKGRPASSGTIRTTPATDRATQSAKSSQRTSHAGFSPGFQIKKSDWPTTQNDDLSHAWSPSVTTSPRPKSFADIIKTNNPPKLPMPSDTVQRVWTPSNFGESETSKTGQFLKQCEAEVESTDVDQRHKVSHGSSKSVVSPRSALLQGMERTHCVTSEEQKLSSNCNLRPSGEDLQVIRCGECSPSRCLRDSSAKVECCSAGCNPNSLKFCTKGGSLPKAGGRKGVKEEKGEGANRGVRNDSPRLRPNSADPKSCQISSSKKVHCSSPRVSKDNMSPTSSQRLQENGPTFHLENADSSLISKPEDTASSVNTTSRVKKKKKKNSSTEINIVKTPGKMVLLTPDLYKQMTKDGRPKDTMSLRDDKEYPVLGKDTRSPRTPRPKGVKVADEDDSADWSDVDSDLEHEDRSLRMAKLAELCTRVSANQQHLGFDKDPKSTVPSRNETSLSYSAVLKQQKGLNNLSLGSQPSPSSTEQPSPEKTNVKTKKKVKSSPKRTEMTGTGGGPTGRRVKPKPNAPIHLDFLQMLTAVEAKKKASKKQKMSFSVGGRGSGREARSSKVFPIVANILDSTAPSRRRGKEREGPVKRHPSALKKVILKEREAKRGQRLQDEERQRQLSGRSSISDADREQVGAATPDLEWEMTPWSPGGKEENPLVAQSFLHSRRFREYCNHTLKPEIDAVVTILLQDLIRFHNRLYHKDPLKAKSRRRIVLGLREVTKHLKLKKLKCLILAPNLDRIRSKGGLDDVIETILTLAKEQNVPFVFALGRKPLGRVCYKQVPVSCVGIFNYSGSENNFYRLMELVAEAQQEYKRMLDSLEDSHTPPSLSRLDGTSDSAYPESGIAVTTGSTPSTSSSASSSPPYRSSTIVPRLHLPLV